MPIHFTLLFFFFSFLNLCFLIVFCLDSIEGRSNDVSHPLRFGRKGAFKILQIADMHYGDGKSTPCEDVLPNQMAGCSDLNTTFFLERIIRAERPDLIIFTGDNIFGVDATDGAKSLNAAFAPAVTSGIPWAAVLGNHDQESTLTREGVMHHIVGMKGSLSRLNPTPHDAWYSTIDGYGNYNLEVAGVYGSSLENKSVVNLYLLDSGDYSSIVSIPGYDWIKPSQQFWFQSTSARLKRQYRYGLRGQTHSAPGLVFFHIPLPEFGSFDRSNSTGVRQEGISSANINSGFFSAMVQAGDVKAVFVGHDHLNDFCGELTGIKLCYSGGFGYHAYGKAGWARRARVMSVSLERSRQGGWGGVKTIRTWKRLDDLQLSTIDAQILWSRSSTGRRRKVAPGGSS